MAGGLVFNIIPCCLFNKLTHTSDMENNPSMIAVIDYGAGNIGSVMNMLKRLAIPAMRATTPEQLNQASAIILPGVGAFDYCMSRFNASGMRDTTDAIVATASKPVLGICVGLQMMFRGSEEGQEKGLSWISGDVVRFDRAKMTAPLKIPHMGWSAIESREDFSLLKNIDNPRFYFVHSYHAVCDDAGDIGATAHYGYEFCCGISRKKLYAAQFHPEKSHRYGMAVLRNFANMAGDTA